MKYVTNMKFKLTFSSKHLQETIWMGSPNAQILFFLLISPLRAEHHDLTSSHPHECFPGSVEYGLLTAASSPACPPVGVSLVVQEAVDVAVLPAVEEAVEPGALLRLVVAVVAASLICLTGLVTLSEAGDGDQVVDCPACTPPVLLMGEWLG